MSARGNTPDFPPPVGAMPALQWVPVSELRVDSAYQRSVEHGESQRLIRRIARGWNWNLVQVLVVSRRPCGLMVIDGQHRLHAARLRGDIAQLPCVVIDCAGMADEAASFVALNNRRRLLGGLELFRAALASGDEQALAIQAAIDAAGLRVAPHTNFTAWKPGMVSNIGGIREAIRVYGEALTRTALRVLAAAFDGQVLRYGGTLFPGVVALCVDARKEEVDEQEVVDFLARRSQQDWRAAVLQEKAREPDLNYPRAAAAAMLAAWRDARGEADEGAAAKERPVLVFKPDESGLAWCEQCEMRVSRAQAEGCKSRWCSMRKVA